MNLTLPRAPFRSRNVLLALGLAGAALLAPAAEAATYLVTFNTSSVAGTAGSVDFQWNLGQSDPSLTASVSNFSGPSFTDRPTVLFGNVAGSLAPGNGLQFASTAPFTYVYQTLSFGSSLTFNLTLPDAAPPDSAGSFNSAFVVSLFDAALNPALPSSSPDGAALLFEFAPGQTPVLSQFGVSSVSAVPEPESYALLMLGIAAIGYRRSRRVKQG